MEYKHNRTSVVMINYHIVFCPKYRRHLLVGDIKRRLDETIAEVAKENNWEVIAKEVMPDTFICSFLLMLIRTLILSLKDSKEEVRDI